MALEEYGRSRYQSRGYTYNPHNGKRKYKKPRRRWRNASYSLAREHKNRPRFKKTTSTDNRVKYPHLYKKSSRPPTGTGRGRKSSVSGAYSVARKPAPKKVAKPQPKKVNRPFRRSALVDPLEHYSVRNFGSDVAFDPLILTPIDQPFDSDAWRGDSEDYGEAFTGTGLHLNIGPDVTSLTAFTERYIETTPVYDAAINLPNTGDYVGIQVRIVEA